VTHLAILSNLSRGDAPSLAVLRSDNPRSARIYPTIRERSKVLFVTSEFADFVQAGGLGAASTFAASASRSCCARRACDTCQRQVDMSAAAAAFEPAINRPIQRERQINCHQALLRL
jgi:hypothetical protein